ncbi:hypothetical protein CK203_002349 [Vitis vinifera]|uniref:DUF4283 domain-containing protein n=1 Tax=Vitis vinifera TaxID=29760 RepID=A0A438KJY3_VITVI|nr:hypothetical protein CK203_002349 [Vitis vinifera]
MWGWGRFTWSGGLNSQSMSRLDRFLVLEDWESHFNRVVQSILPRLVSDHFPVLLNERGAASGENVRHAENRRKRKTSSFGVESKTFELEMVERGGKTLIIITESKKGVSSWVRMGLNSVGLFMEGLHQCIKDVKEGRWEKGWKEKGRSFSLVRVTNRVGCFLRLGVVDLELKRYSICIPKGKGDKRGWTAMVEALRQMDISIDKKEQQEEVKALGRSRPDMVKGRSFADTVKGLQCKRGRSGKLGLGNGKGWGLKGKIGMASLGKGEYYWNLELVEEARRVLLSGNKAVGGVQLDLEWWNPRSGCFEDGEARKEVWVRIFGAPNFAMGPVGVEKGGRCVRAAPSLRQEEGRKRGLWSHPRGEVRGDEDTRIEARVEEMCVRVRGAVSVRGWDWSSDARRGLCCNGLPGASGLLQGPGSKTGPADPGRELNWAYGLSVPSGSESLRRGLDWAMATQKFGAGY